MAELTELCPSELQWQVGTQGCLRNCWFDGGVNDDLRFGAGKSENLPRVNGLDHTVK